MSSLRLPVLLEDGSSLDWSEASYSVNVTLHGKSATVKHRLASADGLQSLIDAGVAEWVVELRCPRTLLSRQSSGKAPRQAVSWRDDEIAGDVYLIPGLVAATEAVAASADGLDSGIWPGVQRVEFPAGTWLAKGEIRSVRPLLMSLVRFRRDATGKLKPGQMYVEEDTDGTDPYFRIDLAPDLYDRRLHERDVQIAGLIAAFGWLPRSSLVLDGDNGDSRVAGRLRAELEANGVPDWDDESFDPAWAATVLEPFRVRDETEADDE